MSVTDVAQYAHLSEMDLEALGAELDTIRREIEAARDATYFPAPSPSIGRWKPAPVHPTGRASRVRPLRADRGSSGQSRCVAALALRCEIGVRLSPL